MSNEDILMLGMAAFQCEIYIYAGAQLSVLLRMQGLEIHCLFRPYSVAGEFQSEKS